MTEKDIYKFWSKKKLKEEIRFLKVLYNQLFDSYKSNSDLYCDKIEKLKKENKQLRQQIEKMRCCENCKHFIKNFESTIFTTLSCEVKNCNDKDKWELAGD